MTYESNMSLEPIRSIVLKHLDGMCVAARSLTQMVRVEEHSYEWGVSWSVSALANSASDEAIASVVVKTSSNIAELEADVSYGNATQTFLPLRRFCTDDLQSVSGVAQEVDEFLRRSASSFLHCCRLMMNEEQSEG